ncbi:hypothetical protein HELRODRAFT_82406 [Helobdella robusta]|uniref:Uncharacterized protein n=1 Tax=Helobdella robusta TaxID=6412 RepID=T1G4R9_HELRO|nr:hypothetical protein HELRODRAFT_82406 [Helobdella robusta]ESO01169.1 hypothetical protein HELRODRAFT_82406 [Helobdella robusta]
MASGGALFGNLARSNQSKNLVEFKAGKSIIKGKMVHPDKRKGLLYIYQSDDQLMHLCWKDRSKGTVEDDLIIFPDDIEYKHVPQCTTGRVYLLKLKSNNKKMFYWMQEPKADKDAELWSKLNEHLNNPPTPSSSRSAASSLLPAELAAGLTGDSTDIHNLLGSMDPQQMLRLITGMGNMSSLLGSRSSSSMSSDSTPSSRLTSATAVERTIPSSVNTSAAATTTVASSTPATTISSAAPTVSNAASKPPTPAILLSDLQNILTSMGSMFDVLKSISPDVLLPLLADPKIQERLVPFLPDGEVIPKTVEELKDTVHSPQFQQTLRSFCGALLTGQLGPLIAQFNLGEDAVAAAEKGDICAFAEALQKNFKKKDEEK